MGNKFAAAWQVSTLLTGAMSKNMPNLRNLAMELRKVCCHPWLCNGLEDDMMMKRQASGTPADTLDALVHSSGKMLLLHKLLPKLRGEGRKVQPLPVLPSRACTASWALGMSQD